MGTVGEEAPTAVDVDSVMTSSNANSNNGDGAIHEPLVHDFAVAAMHNDEASSERGPILTPPANEPGLERTSSWLSDEETAAPPPDFTRRGIHIPSRTR